MVVPGIHGESINFPRQNSYRMNAVEKGAILICDSIERSLSEKKGCLIGRNGTIEMQVLGTGDQIPNELQKTLELHAGIFPSNETIVKVWKSAYISALKNIHDEPIVAGWYKPLETIEKKILEETCPNAPHIPLRCLEPYYVDEKYRWTRFLAGKKVAVVSSFAKTIEKQITIREKIWGEKADSLLPPDTEWIPIQTKYPPILAEGRAGWPAGVTTWMAAVRYISDMIIAKNPDICLIGCGGMGMILAAVLKQKGIICIVMGGSIQVLFGIKGKRWASHDVISKFWNEHWVWPAVDETPKGAAKIEGACYWKPGI